MADYKLTKIEAGDYRLDIPGDPHVWRVIKEEGLGFSSRGMHGSFFWAPARWKGRVGTSPDFDDWSQWDLVGGEYDTRSEATDKALAQPKDHTPPYQGVAGEEEERP